MACCIWATWYDVSENERADFLAWKHAEYLTGLERSGRFRWLAHYESDGGGPAMHKVRSEILQRPAEDVGPGGTFLLLAGMETPDMPFDPPVLDVEREAAGTARGMLALRRGVRTAVFMEQTRVDGPAASPAGRDGPPAPAIQFGTFRVRSVEEEFDLACWYAQYRLPYMERMPGSVGARKLLCIAGWPKHGILYEFSSLADRLKNFEEPHEALAIDAKEWTGRVVRYTIHAPGSPTVARRIWSTTSTEIEERRTYERLLFQSTG